MKIKIKVKVLEEGCMPVIKKSGDWIDLKAASDMIISAPQSGILKRANKDEEGHRDVTLKTTYIPLGVAMQLPAGFEAIVASRSSGPKKFKMFIPNGIGIIDNSYCGNNDQWYYVASSMGNTSIKKGERICQFRVQLNQKATFWQKLKWLFSNGIELIEVKELDKDDRNGLGSTGTW